MAKKKPQVTQFKAPVMAAVAPSDDAIEPSIGDEPVVIVDAVYAFPTKSRCPKCRRLSTRATSTRGEIQLRRCLRPSCGTTYKETGRAI